MHKTGHYGAALALYAPVGFLLSALDPALFVPCGIGTLALARLPDYDRDVPFVSHRGATHSLPFLVVVGGGFAGAGHVVAGLAGLDGVWLAAVGTVPPTVAVGSHLLADALTPAGVPLLWPISDERYSADVAPAASWAANYGLLGFGIAATVVVGSLAGQW